MLSIVLLTFSAGRSSRVRACALEFQAVVGAARSIAAATNDGPGGSGATIQVRRQGAESVVSVYRYRPNASASLKPQLEESVPVLRTPVEIGARDSTTFAIFISSSGHSGSLAGYDIDTGGALAAEPPCSGGTEAIVFREAGAQATFRLTCEMTQLEIEPSPPLPQ
jgi:hypothetical protein